MSTPKEMKSAGASGWQNEWPTMLGDRVAFVEDIQADVLEWVIAQFEVEEKEWHPYLKVKQKHAELTKGKE